MGRRVGRYELIVEIASGGMAAVYLARARGASGFERLVAAKIPHPHLRKDEEFAAMFLDEARLAAKIHHPNVVPVLDFGEAGALYLVMDYVEGHHLAGLIRAAGKKGERLPPSITLRILVDALTGLHAAHELKDNAGAPLHIVHRDTSPQNVLIGVDGIARITDFGIARADARATITRDGQVKGKLSYIAPEQLAGDTVTRRADVFGMGVLLWEALVGQRLFRADSDAETVNLLLSGEIRPPSRVVPSLPPALDAVVLKALARNPDDRYATAAEFAEALERCEIPVATSRQVATMVNELLAESLRARRDEVRRILESGAEFISLVPPMPTQVDSAGTPLSLDDMGTAPRRMSEARRTQIVIAASALFVALVAFIALRGGSSSSSNSREIARAPAANIVTHASTSIALVDAQAPVTNVAPTAVATEAAVAQRPASAAEADAGAPVTRTQLAQPLHPGASSASTGTHGTTRSRRREYSPGSI